LEHPFEGDALLSVETLAYVGVNHPTLQVLIWFLYDLDGKALGRLPFPKGAVGGGHGMTVTDSGDVYVAELSGVVEKFVKTQ
jgi:hypothetical protein